MVNDREAELRRLRRHLSVQEHRVRAATTTANKLRGSVAPERRKEKAEIDLQQAIAGRDGFIKMIKELEDTT